MRIRPASAAAALALGTLAVTGLAAPALAQTPICEPYSTNCPPPPPPPPGVSPNVSDRPESPPGRTVRDRCPEAGTGSTGGSGATGDEDCTTVASTLPFTGGELVLLTAVGGSALVGGVALVAAGRRRTAVAA